jgi:hypothetical protein
MIEIWKDIQGYEGLYQISNLGNVKSLSREWKVGYGGIGRNKTKILTPRLDRSKKGRYYLRIKISKNGKEKIFLIHRLIAEAFIPNLKNKPQINHIDGDTLNNSINNLEWCTPSENMKHAFKIGLIIPPDNKGSKNGRSKLIENDIIQIKKLYNERKITHKEIATMFDVTRSCISSIINNKAWRHISNTNISINIET